MSGVVHGCCGCSCHVCDSGHGKGLHTGSCLERFINQCEEYPMRIADGAVSKNSAWRRYFSHSSAENKYVKDGARYVED